MIDFDSITTALCNDMKTKTGLETIMANQNGPKPKLSFIVLNIISVNELFENDGIQHETLSNSVNVNKSNTLSITLSVSVHTENSYDSEIMQVYEYFKRDYKEVFDSYNLVIHEINQIESRNNNLNVINHNISGFDVIVRAINTVTENVTYIEDVEL